MRGNGMSLSPAAILPKMYAYSLLEIAAYIPWIKLKQDVAQLFLHVPLGHFPHEATYLAIEPIRVNATIYVQSSINLLLQDIYIITNNKN